MQLFTLGLTELNPDGSPVLDANKNPDPDLQPGGGDEPGESPDRMDVSDRAGCDRENQ